MHSHLSLPLPDQYFPELWLHLICLLARKGPGDWLREDPELSCKAEEACALSSSKEWMLLHQSSGPLLQSQWVQRNLGIQEIQVFFRSHLKIQSPFPFLWLPCLQHNGWEFQLLKLFQSYSQSEPDSKLFLPSSYRRWVSLCSAKEADFHVLP